MSEGDEREKFTGEKELREKQSEMHKSIGCRGV
jgi:hypothetical protein